MASSRQLPAKRNPYLNDNIPDYSDLVSRRRLGQTQLTPKMVAPTSSNVPIDPASLPVFDYAHLRAPMPKGIASGIFKSSPGSYFLMRRSFDGYVSATGMFKAAFPYAETAEEELERNYVKSLAATSPDETAGNVWISPEQALLLSEEYGVTPWIRALLDPSDIQTSSSNDGTPQKKISAPPKFSLSQAIAPPLTPTSLPRPSRARRSASPTKTAGTRRSTAPRKKATKATSSAAESLSSRASPGPQNGDASGAPAQLLTPAPSTIAVESSVEDMAAALAPVDEEPKVKISIDQDVEVGKDGTETTRTNVEVEVALEEGLPSAEQAAKMVADAKEMVKAAAETIATNSPTRTSKKGKRKADVLADVDTIAEAGPSAKKVKTEEDLKKQRVTRRALLGLSATIAVGAIVPYVMGML